CVGVYARRAQGGGDDVAGHERSRSGVATELIGDQGEVDEPVAADAAAPVVLADQERGPTEVDASAPVLLVVARPTVATATQLGCRHLLVEELRRGLAEELLVGRQARH